ncbi:MAG: hypothetical protein K2G62_02385 [Oscillospiraceae bacterium]|nr:hypothetical protein [Oscillospiraceae bacterium]
MNHYIGVKRVQAEPIEKDGKPGYKVVYEDGYESWSPKDVFEKAYLPINLPHKLTEEDIDRFVLASVVDTKTINDKLTGVCVTLPNGWIELEGSACVDPKNYNAELGKKYCLDRVKEKMWKYLGFVLQWANNGIKA